MNCIELRIPGKKFRIIKIGEVAESDAVFNASDFRLLEDFLFTGILPDGFQIESYESKSGKAWESSDVNTLINLLKELESGTNNEKRAEAVDENNYRILVDKVIGNRSYRFDDEPIPQRNIVYNKSWGENKTWYGFTQNRFIMFTGNQFLTNGNPNVDKLNIIYKTIKDNPKSLYVKRIESIYNQNHKKSNKVDIMEKLTWVANNRLNLLLSTVMSMDQPFSIPGVENKTLLENHEEILIGKYFKIGGDIYVIVNNDKSLGDFVEAKVLNEQNKNKIVKVNINRIRNLYSSKVYMYKRKQYYNYGKFWSKNQINKSDDIEIIDGDIKNALNEMFIGTIDSDEKLLYFGDSNLHINSTIEINGKKVKVLDLLAPGDSVFTQYGRAVKNDNGEFILENGSVLDLTKDRNYKISNIISFVDNIESILHSFINIDNVENYGPRDIKIIVNSVLGIDSSDFNSSILDNIDIKFNSKNKVSFNINEDGNLTLTISNNITSDDNLELYAALKYMEFCYKNSDRNSDNKYNEAVSNKNTWKTLRNILIINSESDKTISGNERTIAGKPISEWRIELLSSNGIDLNDQFTKYIDDDNSSYIREDEMDEIIKSLIDKGMLLFACEI